MAQETLKITITADNKQAVQNIQETVTATSQLGTAFKKMPNASGQATMALSNLSRVAQDAPYGFMGIANNINPLLESFQRLQSSSGSTGAALKAMGSALIGPAGIGLAVGVVSSLIVSFGDEIMNFVSQTSSADVALSKFNTTMSKGVGEAQAEIDKLVILNGIVDDTTRSTTERQRALEQLKNTYKGNLELQALDIQDGAKLKIVIDSIAESLKRKAMAQAFATVIAEEEAKKVRLQIQSFEEMRGSVGGATKALEFVKAAIMGAGSAMSIVNLNTTLANKALNQNAQSIKDVDANLLQLNTQYKAVISDQIKFNDTTNLSTSALKKQTEAFGALLSLRKLTPEQVGTIVELEKKPRQVAPAAPQTFGGQVMSQALVEAAAIREAASEQKKFNYLLNEAETTANFIAQGVGNIFQAMTEGESLGDAVLNVFKNMTLQLAQMVIQALIFKGIMTALGMGGPVGSTSDLTGGLLGGLGKLLGFTPMAEGGIVSKPTFAMVGEGGESEAVMPLSKLDSILSSAFTSGANSGGGMSSGGSFVLRGNDLVLALQRSNSSLNLRRGGI
jgi:hypothetical protein